MSAIRSLAVSVMSSRPYGAGLGVLERRAAEVAGRLPVLTYHRIAEPDAATSAPGLVSATAEAFAEQVAYLARQWRPISVDELLEVRRGRGDLPPRSVLVTFDDGYADFATGAWPALQAHGVPVVLFVATGFPDTDEGFWWDRLWSAINHTSRPEVSWDGGSLPLGDRADRLVAYRRIADGVKELAHDEALAAVARTEAELGLTTEPPPTPAVLSWDALRRLRDEGVTLAPHTRTHPLLDRVSPAVAEREIAASIADLEQRVGPVPPVFAYPDGHVGGHARHAAAVAGVEVAFTTQRGVNDLGDPDWLGLRRINVGRRATLPVLRTQLLPLADRWLDRVG